MIWAYEKLYKVSNVGIYGTTYWLQLQSDLADNWVSRAHEVKHDREPIAAGDETFQLWER